MKIHPHESIYSENIRVNKPNPFRKWGEQMEGNEWYEAKEKSLGKRKGTGEEKGLEVRGGGERWEVASESIESHP